MGVPAAAAASLPPGSYFSWSFSASKQVLIVPDGEVTIAETLSLGAGCGGIACATPGGRCRISWAGEGPAIHLNGDGTGFDGTIENVMLELKGAKSDGVKIGQNVHDGAGTAKSAQATLINFEIRGGRYGVHLVAGQICRLDRLCIFGADVAVFFDDALYDSHGQVGNVACLVQMCRFERCRVGIDLEAGYHVTVSDCVIQQCSQEAIRALPIVHAVKQLTVRDCYFELNNDGRRGNDGAVYGQCNFGLGVVVKIVRGLFRQDGDRNYHILYSASTTSLDVGAGADAPFFNDATGRNVLELN